MSAPLELIASTSLSLLSTLQAASHAPAFPPRAPPSTAQQLSALRADLATLTATLAHVHTIAVARRKVVPATANESAADKAAREARLRVRVDELRAEVEAARQAGETRKNVVDAINGAWAIEEALRDEGDVKRRMRAQLERKDDLALQLLNLRTKHEKAAAERTQVRKRMFALTRANATLTQELRQSESIESEIIAEMPKDVNRQYQRLVQEATSLISRHAIIRNVFQLVVVESGIPFYTTEPELPNDGMSTAKLQRLMWEAGDRGEHVWDEREQDGEDDDDADEPMYDIDPVAGSSPGKYGHQGGNLRGGRKKRAKPRSRGQRAPIN